MLVKPKLRIEDVHRAFRACLGRDPENGSESYWIENTANYESLTKALEESIEGISYLDRYELAQNRCALPFDQAISKIASVLNLPEGKPSEILDLDSKCHQILKAYVDCTKPALVVAAGGECAEDIACHVAALSGGIALSLSTEAPRNGLTRVPMTVVELVNLLDTAGAAINLAVIDPTEAPSDFATLYRRLPEKGAAICLGECSTNLIHTIHNQKALVWGETIDIEIGLLVTRAIWPFHVPVPRPNTQPIKKKHRTVALAAIVKNEQDEISSMIKSCCSLVDYVLVLDTGSTDKTIDIAQKTLEQMLIPHSIHCTTFVDFSHARNMAISLVPEGIDWLLMLDADEHLTPHDVKCLIDLVETTDAVSIILPRYNLLDTSNHPHLGRYPDRQARFFRISTGKKPYYVNAVHEALIVEGTSIFPPLNTSAFGGDYGGPHIHHRLFAKTNAAMVKKAEAYDRLINHQSSPK